ncbi:hypothetical protein FKM82_022746 [Ascaphus truei]
MLMHYLVLSYLDYFNILQHSADKTITHSPRMISTYLLFKFKFWVSTFSPTFKSKLKTYLLKYFNSLDSWLLSQPHISSYQPL